MAPLLRRSPIAVYLRYDAVADELVAEMQALEVIDSPPKKLAVRQGYLQWQRQFQMEAVLQGFMTERGEFELLMERGRAFVELLRLYPSITKAADGSFFFNDVNEYVLFRLMWATLSQV